MLKPGSKTILLLAAIFAFCTCIDQYTPNLNGYTPRLVIDGLITDANNSYTVKLSYSFPGAVSAPTFVSDAKVSVSDDNGNNYSLTYRRNGIYSSDSSEFRGSVGRTYVLHVTTPEGEQYESDPCLMLPVTNIDSIYVERDEELFNNGNESRKGARIFIDSRAGEGEQYYRWAFKETWKFKVPNPKKYSYVYGEDQNSPELIPVTDVKEYCWKNASSTNIIINAITPGQSNIIERKPITFIAPDESDRFNLQYSILINQYSLSKREYDFWNDLKQINEEGGSLFSKQPFSLKSNIHNLNNPDEHVMGYFQVSAVHEKRKTLSFSDILSLGLPFYKYPCERIIKEPHDFDTEWGPKHTWDYVYRLYCVTSKYDLVEPIFKDVSVDGKQVLYKLVFSTPECANCELSGVSTKPDFWVDLK